MQRIVYLCWPAHEISGGIKAAFQHVEILAEAGLNAVVATADGKAPGWFESSAHPVALDQVGTDDVLVFPENHAGLLKRYADSPQRKVVFCQNPYLAATGLNGQRCYSVSGVTHVLCPSQTVMRFCRRRLPGLTAVYTPFFIDHARFTCPETKVLEIACVPRKRPLEALVIRDMFRATYPQHARLVWHFVQAATEQQVADVMRRAAVFLSLQRFEAHGMTALEAMASGCVVAGFTGVYGGNDSSTAANGFWAAEDDVFGSVDLLGQAVDLAAQQGPAYQELVASARRTAWQWRREEAARLLLAFWRSFLNVQ